MVLHLLYVKADLENISLLSLVESSNICVSVRNPLSDYEVREKVTFNTSETIEQEENTREHPCHFALKWDGSHKRSTLTVLDAASAKSALKKRKYKGEQPRALTSDDSSNWVPILVMECRGLEPYAFHALGNEFEVISEGGVKFESDVDLSEGDWADYDDENDAPVSISDLETKFEAV